MPDPLKEVRRLIGNRLEAIQRRFNFNPELGAEQVDDGDREMQRLYGQFSLLLELNQKARLGIEVPYDPEGLTPEAKAQLRALKQKYLYFCQVFETQEWHIGHSFNTYKRRRALQTGNPRYLILRHKVAAGTSSQQFRELERQVHQHLRNFSIPGRSKKWFFLPTARVQSLVDRLQAGERAFLKGMLPDPKKTSVLQDDHG